MEKLILRTGLLLILICAGFTSWGVNPVEPVEKQSNVNNNELTSKTTIVAPIENVKELKKEARKQKKINRKIKRMQKRLAKWADSSKKYFGGATDNPKFRLGLLCLLAGIGFVLLVNIIGLGWLLGGLGGLVAVIGICLMIWGVLEYTN